MNEKFQISLKLLLWDKNFFLYLRDSITKAGDLPGGRIVSKNEFFNWLESLKREIQEELGHEIQYEIQPNPVFVFPHIVLKEGVEAVAVLYEGKYLGGRIRLSSEHLEYRWLHKHEDLSKYFTSTFLKGLQDYFRLKKSEV
ncbi:MAG: NUDIX hydrolase [Leptospiraceae bacterium]|nr:NUDIX hydrolase [Leptospiraceae bacterium]MDW7976621.1 NUDIX hydrolase [Leptospiraceae bacterium]